MAKWFDTKFHAHLEAPKARKIINDLADTKLHSHKVLIKNVSYHIIGGDSEGV